MPPGYTDDTSSYSLTSADLAAPREMARSRSSTTRHWMSTTTALETPSSVEVARSRATGVVRARASSQRRGQRVDASLRVTITKRDYEQMLSWTLDYPRIETGGDLFGTWLDSGGCVVKAVTGPGVNAQHHATAFFQDKNFLAQAGRYLEANGAYHLGTWHSHHTIGLPQPSSGDDRSFHTVMAAYGRSQFLALIAAIEHNDAVVRPYLYSGLTGTGRLGAFDMVEASADPVGFLDHSKVLNSMARIDYQVAPEAPRTSTAAPAAPPAWIREPSVSGALKDAANALSKQPFKVAKIEFKGDDFIINFTHQDDVPCSLTFARNFKSTFCVKVDSTIFAGPVQVTLSSLQAVRKELYNHCRSLFAKHDTEDTISGIRHSNAQAPVKRASTSNVRATTRTSTTRSTENPAGTSSALLKSKPSTTHANAADETPQPPL